MNDVDWIVPLEAAYDTASSADAWLDGILAALTRTIAPLGCRGRLFERRGDLVLLGATRSRGPTPGSSPLRVPRRNRPRIAVVAGRSEIVARAEKGTRGVQITMPIRKGETFERGELTALRRVLGHVATRVESAPRAGIQRLSANDAEAQWRALALGRWRSIDQFDHDGRRYVVALRRRSCARAPSLGRRERHVAALAAMGHSNKAIAYELGVATSTVSAYLRDIARKLGPASRVELVRRLIDAGRPCAYP